MDLPALDGLTDPALLLLRLLMAALFATSGWSHVRRPVDRGESIGMSPGFTRALGVAELVGAASVGLGLFTRVGALLLIAVMVGAIRKKVLVWKTGFWGDDGQGWFYDLLYATCNLVILGTGGGSITLA
jgi:putative oxidoreductase